MIAAGVALNDATLRRRGLDLLAWLVDYETADRHLSPTPIAGRGPGTSTATCPGDSIDELVSIGWGSR